MYDSPVSSNPKFGETESADEDETMENQRKDPVDESKILLDDGWRFHLSPS